MAESSCSPGQWLAVPAERHVLELQLEQGWKGAPRGNRELQGTLSCEKLFIQAMAGGACQQLRLRSQLFLGLGLREIYISIHICTQTICKYSYPGKFTYGKHSLLQQEVF